MPEGCKLIGWRRRGRGPWLKIPGWVPVTSHADAYQQCMDDELKELETWEYAVRPEGETPPAQTYRTREMRARR